MISSETVRLAQSGDRAALASVCDRVLGVALAVAAEYGVPPRDHRDVAQETVAMAIGAIHRFDARGRHEIGSWAYTIARNLIYKTRRKLSRQRRRLGVPVCHETCGLQATGTTPDRVHDAVRAMERLSAGDRDILVQHYLYGHEIDEMAQKLDTNARAVAQRLYVARKRASNPDADRRDARAKKWSRRAR